jgi:AcrR family transcriptional regulator
MVVHDMKIQDSIDVKKNILSSAKELFSNKGYRATTMKEIACESKVSVGSLYIHFKDKRDIYMALIKEQSDKFNRYISINEKYEPVEALKGIVNCYLEYSIKNTKLININLTEGALEAKDYFVKYFHEPQEKLINNIIEKGINVGVFKDIDKSKIGKLLISILTGIITFYVRGEIKDIKEYGNILISIILDGLKRSN